MVVMTCDECQQMNKKPITTPTVLHPVFVHSPWRHVVIDFIGPIHPVSANGNKFVLTISDYFTKWVEAIPLPNKCALGVAKTPFIVQYYYYCYNINICVISFYEDGFTKAFNK